MRVCLKVCRSCRPDFHGQRARAFEGEALYQLLKERRHALNLEEVVQLEGVDCLNRCAQPCNVDVEHGGKVKYARGQLHAQREADGLLFAARTLQRGERALLPHELPGLPAD
jgi:predicted metal-binding protein